MKDNSWKKEVDELKARRKMAEKLGGEESVARQKSQGKLTARERIKKLLDENSFFEIGSLAGNATYDSNNNISSFVPSNFVGGIFILECF
jgi:propionyl-CoA carboxylase beta chain